MENSGGISASLPGRYATALFELAEEKKAIDKVAESLSKLDAALTESGELRRLTTSPVVERDEAGKAMAALAKTLKLDPLTTNVLGVLADNRRLPQLRGIVRAYRQLLAAHRGEISAEVTSAFALSEAQVGEISKQLKKRVGSDVALSTSVDPSLLGGLVVTIGSQRIDSSIRTRLNTLAHAMKG